MVSFDIPPGSALTPFRVAEGELSRKARRGARTAAGWEGGIAVVDVVGQAQPASDLPGQFLPFLLNPELDGPAVISTTDVESTISGSDASPDVLMRLSLVSFHLATKDKGDKNSPRATVRVTLCKDENAAAKTFDTAFWAITAGLRLFDEARNGTPKSGEFATDFGAALGNRPIEIPGGLANLTFDVVKHVEPPWWKRVFKFLQSEKGAALTSVLGFPALTRSALGVVSELLERVTEKDHEVLFKSRPLRLALSKFARSEFTGGNKRIKVGSITPGFLLLVKASDHQALVQEDVVFYPALGVLVPRQTKEEDLFSGKFNDPLADVTYAVFRLGMRETKLDPTFSFGG